MGILAAAALPGGTGVVLLGLSAAAQATNDALDRGMSKKQAFWTGLMAGAFEAIFEKWSIGNFKALKTVANAHGKDILLNIAKSMLVNASEETLTEIANIAYDSIVNGEFSQYETKVRQYVVNGMTESEAKSKAAQELGWQVGEAAASGTLMGLGFGVTGSAGSVVQNVAQKITSNKAQHDLNTAQSRDAASQGSGETSRLDPDNAQALRLKAPLNSGESLSNGDLQTLQPLAKERTAAADTEAQTNTAEGSAKSSQRELADHQVSANGDSTNKYASVDQEDVAKHLMRKGFNPKKSADIAEVILARLNGQKLTSTQINRLRSATDSPAVLDVISDIMKNSKPTVEQRITESSVKNQKAHISIHEMPGDDEKLQQNQVPKQRYNEFSETTNLSEQHEGQYKVGSTWENGEMSELTYEGLSASSKELKRILGVDDSQGLKKEVNRSIIEIQNGFACFPEGDSLNDNAKMVPPLDGFFDVAMHGTPRNVEFRLAENKLNARTLAIIIRHSKGYTGQNIRLLSCNTGKVVGESYCFAEELANALGVTVTAPNKALYIFPDGRLRVGKYGDGEFINYKPNQRRRLR